MTMAPSNILITGAAGYIGGSIVAELLGGNIVKFERTQITAAVRSDEQAKALSPLGINVLQLDLTNENAVVEAVLHNKIDIVIHTASSIDASLALHLITALSKRKEASGEETYFIHTSALSAFYEKTGWPAGATKDTDSVFAIEKELADSFPIRNTDVTVTEHAKAQGVKSFIVVPSTVYGKGTGEWNRLSVVLPVYVKAAIAQGKVYKFAENTKVSGVHISDMTALYAHVVWNMLRNEEIPHGEEGYYFALAHDIYWWEFLDHLAAAMKARSLVKDAETQLWASDAAAAEALGVPVQFLQPLWNSDDNLISKNPFTIGWKPTWDEDRFLRNIDEEVLAVLELDKAKSSLISSLFEAAKE